MNEEMPACATIPTADLRPGGISRYHGNVSSKRFRVAVASSPETVFNHARVCSFDCGAEDFGVATDMVIVPISSRHRQNQWYQRSHRATNTSRSPAGLAQGQLDPDVPVSEAFAPRRM